MKLDLRFIVPGPSPGTILLASDRTLPEGTADGDEDEAAIIAVDALLRERWADPAPVLETHPRWMEVPDGEPIPTLVTTERAPADWAPPEGLSFQPIPAAIAGLPGVLEPRAAELIDELRTGAPPPELRPRWARPGWHDRAASWMADQLARAGRPLLEPARPFFLRGISAVLRGRTAGGAVFLKAVFPPFHAEPVLTRLLADRFPDAIPRVLAIEPDEGWQLVEDVGAAWIFRLPSDEKAPALAAGARTLVAMQLAITAGDIAALVVAGSPRRPLAEVPDAFDAAVGDDGVAFVDGTVTPERRDRARSATRAAVERVLRLGFPDTVVHGDFHAGNAALRDGRVVIIDWSDAAIGNPVIDLVTWLSWSNGEPEDQQAAIDAWIDAWAGPTDPRAVRAAIDDILVVGAAYQVISYDGIVRALEPLTRYTMAGGASLYLGRLEERLAGKGTGGR